MLREAGLPDEMLRAAAAILDRWADAKDDGTLSIDRAIQRLKTPTE
jgi:hypothetical protein